MLRKFLGRYAGAIGMALALGMYVLGYPSARAQGPLQVQPDDITTPTARTETSLLPTSTPAPGGLPPAAETPAAFDTQASANFYMVKSGDTVLSVAVEIGIDLEEMHCVVSPNFQWDQPLVVGEWLDIPEPGFRCHTVQAGETLDAIAGQYGVSTLAIQQISWNRLANGQTGGGQLALGSHLRIPPEASIAGNEGGLLAQLLERPVGSSPLMIVPVGGVALHRPEPAVPSNWPYGSGYFEWPVTGWMSQGYRQDHRALDIAAPAGTFVMAADRGAVIRAGWNNQGYGHFVVIDHNIDYVTLYAHLDQVLVSEDQVVGKGAILGTVGSTGNSTGPHLHFEIRDFGRRINPLELLLLSN